VLKNEALIVILILSLATTSAGCTELVNIVNGRDAAATPLPVLVPIQTATPTATVTPTQAPTLMPTPTLTPTPTPAPTLSPSPANNSTATPTPSPTPTPTPAPTPEPPAFQNDTRVTGAMNVQQPIGIWDHYLVYDEKVGNDESYFIYLYDILTHDEQTIASGNVRSYGCIGGEAGNGKVALIFGDYKRIMLYDINSGALEAVIADSSADYRSPSIDGRHLMYINDNDPQNPAFVYIYDYDTVAKTLNRMMAAPDPNDLRYSGGNIVWWLRNGDLRRVGLIQNWFDAGFSFISPANIFSDHPRVSGNTVVYHCVVNGAGYINVYNVETSATTRVTNEGSQSSCDVNGARIVYDDNRDGNWNIYMTDRATGKEVRLTDEPHDQTSPIIWGDYVAYMDNRNGGPDIYVLTIGV
jgi:beta propeller repeat protein